MPAQVPILTASNAQRDSLSLVWGPPLESNGVLTGYLLRYQLGMYHSIHTPITLGAAAAAAAAAAVVVVVAIVAIVLVVVVVV